MVINICCKGVNKHNADVINIKEKTSSSRKRTELATQRIAGINSCVVNFIHIYTYTLKREKI